PMPTRCATAKLLYPTQRGLPSHPDIHGGKHMRLTQHLTALALGLTALGAAAQTVVGVSWSNFQEERWKTDEAAIKGQLEKLGAKYISADAGGSAQKQLA